MTKISKPSDNVPSSGGPAEPGSSEETRRQEARRRFLVRGTAAGSGVAIYSFQHTRTFAKGRKLMVSSPEACASLGGSTGKQKKAVDSLNPIPILDSKGRIKGYEKNAIRYECEFK